MRFFDAIKLLFPRSKLFRFFPHNTLSKFSKALSVLPEDVRTEAEKTHADLFPMTTRNLPEWEDAFELPFTYLLTEIQRRSFLQSIWRSRHGAATAEFLEMMLNYFVPGIKVIENIPVRMPRANSVAYTCIDGNRYMRNGNKYAIDGRRIGDRHFSPTMLKTNYAQPYNIPQDSRYWETCFYVCGSVLRNVYHEIILVRKIQIPAIWKPFIEYIILQIKPLHMSAIMFIEYI